MLGFYWHYFALMEGHVFDITEWMKCHVRRFGFIAWPQKHSLEFKEVHLADFKIFIKCFKVLIMIKAGSLNVCSF